MLISNNGYLIATLCSSCFSHAPLPGFEPGI
jgi:hypothetical protein